MEFQRMAGLEVSPVPDGYDPVERERDLQRVIKANRPETLGQATPARTIGELLARVRFNMEASVVEWAELLDHLPWKSWKSYGVAKDSAPEAHPELVTEMKFEVVDLLHFLLNCAIALDMDYQELLAIFEAKQQENRRRQEEGYR
jgi:dUTPase